MKTVMTKAGTAKKDPRMPGMPWMTACMIARDLEKSIEFYKKAFGFEEKFVMRGPDGKPQHAELKYEDALIMLGPEGFPGCSTKSPASSKVDNGMGLYLYCDDVDAFYLRAIKAGAEVLAVPQDAFWGDRTVRLRDIDGYNWHFATNVREFDPSKVPQK